MIAIGCDHGGYELKQKILAHLRQRGLEYRDFGCDSTASVDYPVYGKAVAHAVGIRCALCGDCFSAKATRLHNNANVLALGALVTGSGLALEIVDIFLDTPFSEEERHRRRIAQLEEA